MSRFALTILGLCFAAAGAVHGAQCEVRARGAALLELYTSEGCSSCPPAEAWVNTLAIDGAMVPIAFHVDYWAYLGWKDRFDLPNNANRHAQRAREAGTAVYTPGLFLNGQRAQIGSAASKRNLISGATTWLLRVQLNAEERSLRARAVERPAGCEQAACEVEVPATFALTENKLSSRVDAGENRGRTLHHEHVARLLWSDAKSQAIPSAVKLEHAQLVAWREQDGKAREAVAVGLANCTN